MDNGEIIHSPKYHRDEEILMAVSAGQAVASAFRDLAANSMGGSSRHGQKFRA